MKAALVFPGITDVGFNSFGDGIDGSWHSHGLMTLGGCLRSTDYGPSVGAATGGHETALIDLRQLSGWDAYRDRLAEVEPRLVCITMMSCDFNPAVEAGRIAKEVLPGAHVAVGGAHPSICPDEVVGRDEFDTVVLGEGEVALMQLAAALEAGQAPPARVEGDRPDLDKLPYCDRSLFGPHEVPIAIRGFEPPFMTFIAGRGCMYNCSFCQPAERKIFGRKVRRRSPEHFVGELADCYRRYGFNSALIHDDCLLEDPAWIAEFVELVRREKLDVRFACQGRADLVCKHPDMIDALKSVGLGALIVGFESGSDRVLKFLRKGVTREQNLQAGRILHEKGVAIWANYMFGLPGETLEEMQETITMLQEIAPEHYSPAVYTPHPGSDLFETCRKEGLLMDLSHDSYRRNVTEQKIRGQDWHMVQWAVSESTKPPGELTPYSPDYVIHWGDLENALSGNGMTEMSLPFHRGRPLHLTGVENCSRGANAWTFRSTTTDPQLLFDIDPPLHPNRWRYLFVDVEVSASCRGQFVWWTDKPGVFQATRHFRLPFGRHSFAFELARLKTYQKQIGSGIAWNDRPVSRLRFDPAESEDIDIALHRIWVVP